MLLNKCHSLYLDICHKYVTSLFLIMGMSSMLASGYECIVDVKIWSLKIFLCKLIMNDNKIYIYSGRLPPSPIYIYLPCIFTNRKDRVWSDCLIKKIRERGQCDNHLHTNRWSLTFLARYRSFNKKWRSGVKLVLCDQTSWSFGVL